MDSGASASGSQDGWQIEGGKEMNYEEKYKEALERAKKFEEKYGGDYAGYIFPELAESEDERIRKAIIHYILYENKGAISEDTEHTWVKWLEKQKENPKSADSISADCVSDAKCEDRWHKVTDSLPDNGRLVLAKDCLGNVLLARYDGENWEVNVYDNEDHYCHNSISKWCEIPSEKQKEQKLTATINGETIPTENHSVNIPLAEWSEEDEDMIQYIIASIDTNIAASGFHEMEDWLKSLRPSWKPSEEQMEALESAVKLYKDTHFEIHHEKIVSLYEQLKKLM